MWGLDSISSESLSSNHSYYVVGNLKMELLRYEKDARSIPVTGEQNGVIRIGPRTTFSIKDEVLYLTDPDIKEPGTVPVGTHMQYVVNIN